MATLKVTITESVTLNGRDQGGTYAGFSNANITQVHKLYIKLEMQLLMVLQLVYGMMIL